MYQNLRQTILRLPILHLSSTKFVFLLLYSNSIRVFITARKLRNVLENTVNLFESNNPFKGDQNLINPGAEDVEISHVQVTKNAIANLEGNFTFIPAYNLPLKIMPLGDSITRGVIGNNDKDGGGYRIHLWNKFVADGLRVEFVGSQSNGPNNLGNKYHEGHPGWTIKQIAASVNEWLYTFQPNIILLMIGTNDTRINSLKTMISELSALIDQITAQSPDAQLLVASIPPIYPTANSVKWGLRAMYFNAVIPEIVNSKFAQGKKVNFVDMRSLTINDLTSSLSRDLDNGLHPNTQGYRQIANFWHDAVLKVTSNRQMARCGPESN